MLMMPLQVAPSMDFIHGGTDLLADYSYFSNAVKICLIVKPTLLCQAKAIFHGSGIVITDSGKRQLLSLQPLLKVMCGKRWLLG